MTLNSRVQVKRWRGKRMMRLSSGKFEIFLPTLVLLLYVYQAYPVHSSILNPISSSRINKQSNTVKLLSHEQPARIVQLIGGKAMLECPISPLVLTRTIRQQSTSSPPHPLSFGKGVSNDKINSRRPTGTNGNRVDRRRRKRSDILQFERQEQISLRSEAFSLSGASGSGRSRRGENTTNNVIDETPTRAALFATSSGLQLGPEVELVDATNDLYIRPRRKRKILTPSLTLAQSDDDLGSSFGLNSEVSGSHGDSYLGEMAAQDSIELILWYHISSAVLPGAQSTVSGADDSGKTAGGSANDQLVTRPIYIVDARRQSGAGVGMFRASAGSSTSSLPSPSRYGGGASGSGNNNNNGEPLVQVRGPESEDSIKAASGGGGGYGDDGDGNGESNGGGEPTDSETETTTSKRDDRNHQDRQSEEASDQFELEEEEEENLARQLDYDVDATGGSGGFGKFAADRLATGSHFDRSDISGGSGRLDRNNNNNSSSSSSNSNNNFDSHEASSSGLDDDKSNDDHVRKGQKYEQEFQLASAMGARIAANSARHFAASSIKSRVKFGLSYSGSRKFSPLNQKASNGRLTQQTVRTDSTQPPAQGGRDASGPRQQKHAAGAPNKLPVAYLIIDKLEASDAGQYKCRVDFKFARTRYHVSQLKVIAPLQNGDLSVKMVSGDGRPVELEPLAGEWLAKSLAKSERPSVSLMAEPKEVNEDEQLEFECSTKGDEWPAAQVAWWRVYWLPVLPVAPNSTTASTTTTTVSNANKGDENPARVVQVEVTRLPAKSSSSRAKVSDSQKWRKQRYLNRQRLAQLKLDSINASSVAAIITNNDSGERQQVVGGQRESGKNTTMSHVVVADDNSTTAATQHNGLRNNNNNNNNNDDDRHHHYHHNHRQEEGEKDDGNSNYDDNHSDNDSSWMTKQLELALANFMRLGLGGSSSMDSLLAAYESEMSSKLLNGQLEGKLIAHIAQNLDWALRFGEWPKSTLMALDSQQQPLARFLARNQFVLYVCGASNTHNFRPQTKSPVGGNNLLPIASTLTGAPSMSKDTNQLGGVNTSRRLVVSAQVGDKLAKIKPTFSSILVRPNVVPKYVRIFLVNRRKSKHSVDKQTNQQQIELTPLESGQFVHLNLGSTGSPLPNHRLGRTSTQDDLLTIATNDGDRKPVDHEASGGGAGASDGHQLQFVCLAIGGGPPEVSSISWSLANGQLNSIRGEQSMVVGDGHVQRAGNYSGNNSFLKLVRDNQTETEQLMASASFLKKNNLPLDIETLGGHNGNLDADELELLKLEYQYGYKQVSSIKLHNINIWDHETTLTCSASNELYNRRANKLNDHLEQPLALPSPSPQSKLNFVETSIGLNISHVPFVRLSFNGGGGGGGGGGGIQNLKVQSGRMQSGINNEQTRRSDSSTKEINVAFGQNISLICDILFTNPPPLPSGVDGNTVGQLVWLVNGKPLDGSIGTTSIISTGDGRQVALEVLERRQVGSYANINIINQQGQQLPNNRPGEEMIFKLNLAETRLKSAAVMSISSSSSSSSSSLTVPSSGSGDPNGSGSEKSWHQALQVTGGEVSLPLKCKVTNALGFGISNELNLVAGNPPYCLVDESVALDNPLTSREQIANMASNGSDKANSYSPLATISGLSSSTKTSDKVNGYNTDDPSFFCPVSGDKHSSSYHWLLEPGGSPNSTSGRNESEKNSLVSLSTTDLPMMSWSKLLLLANSNGRVMIRNGDNLTATSTRARLFCYASDKFGSNDKNVCTVKWGEMMVVTTTNNNNDNLEVKDSQRSTSELSKKDEFKSALLTYGCMANLIGKSPVVAKTKTEEQYNQENVFTPLIGQNRSGATGGTPNDLAPPVEVSVNNGKTNRLLLELDCQQDAETTDHLTGSGGGGYGVGGTVNKSDIHDNAKGVDGKILVNFDLYRTVAGDDAQDQEQQGHLFVKRLTSRPLNELSNLSLILDLSYDDLNLIGKAAKESSARAYSSLLRSTGMPLLTTMTTMGEAVNMHNIVLSFIDTNTHSQRYQKVSLPLNGKRVNLGAPTIVNSGTSNQSIDARAGGGDSLLSSSSLLSSISRQINDRFLRTSDSTATATSSISNLATATAGQREKGHNYPGRGWVFLIGNIVLVLLGSLAVLTFVWVCKANSSSSDIDELRRKAERNLDDGSCLTTTTCATSNAAHHNRDNNNPSLSSNENNASSNGSSRICTRSTVDLNSSNTNNSLQLNSTNNIDNLAGLYFVGMNQDQDQFLYQQQQQQPVACSLTSRYENDGGDLLFQTPKSNQHLTDRRLDVQNDQTTTTTCNAKLSYQCPINYTNPINVLVIDSTSPNSNDSGIGQQQHQHHHHQLGDTLVFNDHLNIYQDHQQQQTANDPDEEGWLELVTSVQRHQAMPTLQTTGYISSRTLCESVTSSNHDTDQGIQLMISGSDSSSPNRCHGQHIDPGPSRNQTINYTRDAYWLRRKKPNTVACNQEPCDLGEITSTDEPSSVLSHVGYTKLTDYQMRDKHDPSSCNECDRVRMSAVCSSVSQSQPSPLCMATDTMQTPQNEAYPRIENRGVHMVPEVMTRVRFVE